MTTHLSLGTLFDLPEAVGKPTYARDDIRPGIVHFGVGNFHRAHQGSYLDRLFSMGLGHEWAIIGAGVMPAEERTRETLRHQDWLTLLVTQSAEASTARVIAPMIDFLPIGDGAAIVACLADPMIRIVSLTVTEGGYFLNADGAFDPSREAVRADAATPDRPRTVFGLMLKALRQRRDTGIAPFTVMSCDNLPHNGTRTRGTLVGLARLFDPAFADWVEANVAFPNGMVDRITPTTSDRERRLALEDYGVADALPVFSEDFIQWVLEDDFPQGRPPLEEVGVTFVTDVTPYEDMKLRLLNASHAIIAYPAALLGIEFAHEAIVHPMIGALLEKIQVNEVLPGITAVGDMDPRRYFDTVRARFANPKIADTIARLCYDGANRQPKFIVPAIRYAIDQGLPLNGLALSSALWCHYCAGLRDDGATIAANDPEWSRLHTVALAAKQNPDAWLLQQDIYGIAGTDPRLRTAFAEHLATLSRSGTLAALVAYLNS